jgi:hypothetical protein
MAARRGWGLNAIANGLPAFLEAAWLVRPVLGWQGLISEMVAGGIAFTAPDDPPQLFETL